MDTKHENSGVNLPILDTKEEKTDIFASNELVSSSFMYNQGSLDVLFYLLKNYKDHIEQYSFSVPELERLCGKRFNRQHLYRDLTQVSSPRVEASNSVSVELSDPDIKVQVVSKDGSLRLFDLVDYQRGVFTIKVTEHGKPMLAAVSSNFTKMDVCEALMLPSMYSKRLYMILCQYMGSSKFWPRVDYLKKIMSCTPRAADGDSHSKKENFRFIEILQRAIKSINLQTTISVVMDTKPMLSAVSRIHFTITERQEDSDDLKKLIRYFEKHDIEETWARIAYVNGLREDVADSILRPILPRAMRAQANGKYFNIKGYFITVLQNKKFIPRSDKRVAKAGSLDIVQVQDSQVQDSQVQDSPVQDSPSSG